MTPESVTIDAFLPLLGSVFALKADNLELNLELIEANPIKHNLPGTRQGFSLMFRAPNSAVLSQQTIALEHEVLGLFELFVVPIGSDEIGMRYEAIFN